MSRDRKKKKDEGSNADWMTTYGDMMTLLLAFFVLLYSFSSIDASKFQMVMDGLQGKLGVLPGGRTVTRAELIEMGLDSSSPSNRQFNELNNKINQYIELEGLEEQISVEEDDKGLVIRFSGKVLFGLGSSQIKDNAKPVLSMISGLIKSLPNDVAVEGHTDNWPINSSRYPSNWELSTARATNVVRYFIEENNINPSRLSAAGYSEYRPIRANDTSQNRALNRRVDVIVLRMDEEEDYYNEW
ncbi:flagellar motor protein MotB [Halonatronum saccharophilum]|uniref:flagellar motor protein MotB n=1 Tax=Halonatronum saccharophilum TaxID=150060 RepID=UPI000483360A|nr:flagellar motor protein MotB [Halonatronum saccharophilum]